MKNPVFSTPVLFIVFNRPDTTKLVFEEIRKVRPTQLYVTGDGPRTHKEGEQELVRQAREIATAVDWPCEVTTLFREKNLGCKYAVGGALNWFFGQVEEGIVLEDDDLPDPSFFPFCVEMLERYRDDERIMHISGNNFQQKNEKYVCDASYYFSAAPHIWGWASWKRAWKHYDIEVRQWPEVRDKGLLKGVFDGPGVFRWGWLFQQYYDKKINSYDTQWAFACIINRGLAITPRTNLVTNIGFGPGATHGQDPSDHQANIPLEAVSFPLMHPREVMVHSIADAYTYRYLYRINFYWSQRARWFFKSRFPRLYVFLKKNYHWFVHKRTIDSDTELALLA